MSWKDYFYFQKGDRIAILILFTLIVISGSAYFFSRPKVYEKEELPTKFKEDFIRFQSEITEIDLNDQLIKEKQEKLESQNKKTSYPYIPKLKTGETIEINKADTTQLKRIPGIGSSYANRIVKYRNLLGGYVEIEQLKEVWGIDNDLFEAISTYITIEPKVQKLKINSANFKELIKHPYVNSEQAKITIDIRERKGKIESINRLALLDEFSEEDIKRLTPYLNFD